MLPFEPEDLNLLHETFTDPFVRKYLMDDEIISIERSSEFMSINEQTFRENGWGLWKIRVNEDDTYAGFAGLWNFFDEDQPQLLYGLLEDHTRKGYAVEASKAVMEYAFTTLNFSYLVAACDTPNTDSLKVCELLKFKRVEEKEINVITAELTRIPTNTVELTEEQATEVLKLVDNLEQDEDVQKVYHNLK